MISTKNSHSLCIPYHLAEPNNDETLIQHVSKQEEQEKYMSTDLLQKKYSGPWKSMLERHIIRNSVVDSAILTQL